MTNIKSSDVLELALTYLVPYPLDDFSYCCTCIKFAVVMLCENDVKLEIATLERTMDYFDIMKPKESQTNYLPWFDSSIKAQERRFMALSLAYDIAISEGD